MSKQTMITIDPEKIRAFLAGHGKGEVTRMIGKAPNYFNHIVSRRVMPANVLNALCAIYDTQPEDFKPDPKPVPEPIPFKPEQASFPCSSVYPSYGYALDLTVYPDYVRVALYEDSQFIKAAKARIKNGADATRLDIVQAISYATHMIYKFMEQDVIE